MKKSIIIFGMGILSLACTGCANSTTSSLDKIESEIPEILQGQTFVYDQLETGEGTSLYTLMFDEEGYRLYLDQGTGIISEGNVLLEDNKQLIFLEEEQEWQGSYRGSAFSAPTVTLEYQEKQLQFQLAADSTEYTYLSYLGILEGTIQEKPAVLVLERWFEFYLYTDETLVRGYYEIYEDGRVQFKTEDGTLFGGTVQKGENPTFLIDVDTKALKASDIFFSYAQADISYSAEHAMGDYTLSFYEGDIFAIHGVDGLLKAMGTVSMANGMGVAQYFPRLLTNDMEIEEDFSVAFTYGEDWMTFPEDTPLLPRSGNIDEDTGYGSYWTAGTILSFQKTVSYEEKSVGIML